MDAFRAELDEEVKAILSSSFKVVVVPTDLVPSVEDPDLTYPNLDTREQRCKLLESCILYVDIRDSTKISDKHQRETLVGLYAAFVRAMSRCAGYFGGRVRNIIGDRVMVLFDRKDCFANAVNTAILMNSVAQYMIDQAFKLDTFECGIGIDYGKMLIAKAGIIKQGKESASSRSLSLLGRPANVASKLTDEANKMKRWSVPIVEEGHYYDALDEWGWYEFEVGEFLDRLIPTYSPILRHPDEYFETFHQSYRFSSRTMPPILMTEVVFNGFKQARPDDASVKNNWWKRQNLSVSGYSGTIYGGGVIFTLFKNE